MFLEAGLLTRRSVRQFEKDREIPQSDIDDILKIAMYAPSARNTQPWEFVVVKDKKMRDKIAEVHPYAKFLKDASLAIVVCGDTNQETAPGYWVVDTSIATENLLLACHGRGLGACWCGVYPNEERMNDLKELLKLPDNTNPMLWWLSVIRQRFRLQPKDRFKPEKTIMTNGNLNGSPSCRFLLTPYEKTVAYFKFYKVFSFRDVLFQIVADFPVPAVAGYVVQFLLLFGPGFFKLF